MFESLNKIDNNCLLQATQLYSPNKNSRPAGTDIRLIVIHAISLPPDQFGGHWIDDFFLNQLDPNQHPYFKEICTLKVSSHLLIRRDGQVTQYVPFDERAWHAGVSSYAGVENCNDYSIGIELEGADHIPYTEEQYTSLMQCCQTLIQHYPALTKQTIVGHCDISPGRKTDPGKSFDWLKFNALLSSS